MTNFLLALAAAAGPSPDLGAAADAYAWIAGSWHAEVIDYPEEGPPRRGRGEWHFAWVLDGRALQDVWIVPPRGERGARSAEAAASGPGNRYGSTLRYWDAEDEVWRIVWINPVTGVQNLLAGRRVGDDLVHEGVDTDGSLIRWRFTEITRGSFRWLGESSRDGGDRWRLDAEFRAVRAPDHEAHAATGPDPTLSRRWRWDDRPGLESVEITRGDGGVVADGAVLVVLEGVPTEVRYRLEYDAEWRFRRATVRSRSGDPRASEIERDAAGAWRVDGVARPDLAGCTDIDLMATPFTNMPPLRSHPLAPGEARTLRVAWLRWPELTVQAVEQEYRRLDEARYRYRNLDSGFESELTVDDDLLVTAYGPWRLLR